MAFMLGNFNIDEILYGIAETFDGQLLYSLDQLTTATIEVSSESNDITDKNGNIVRTIYRSKTGNFSATNAFLHPQIMNASSGSLIQYAGTGNGEGIVMPKVSIVAAGTTLDLDASADDDTVTVIGLYGSGANSPALTKGSSADWATLKFGYDATENKLTVPAAAEGAPVNYLIKYDRVVTSGMKLSNVANVFPQTVKMTFYCSYVNPCSDTLQACYVVLPSFQASPETTISLSAEEQTMDFSGTLQIGYCDAQPALYYIYFPEEQAQKIVIGA